VSLSVDARELARLHAHAQEGYPHEVVGILAGRRSDRSVTRVHPLRNERADSAHNRYKVSGLVLMRAERALEAEGLEIVGYYHSHPDHPAQYSDFDREHALPNMSYLITAVHEGRVVDTLSWRLVEDRSSMDAEDIQIQEPPMSVTIHIPTPLRAYTDRQAAVSVEGSTVGEALQALTGRYPSLEKHLRTGEGQLRSFVNVYLGEEDIRFLDKEATAVTEGAELTIVPSIAGGAS
jgi:molybdopterin synthase sulfur carrier subunit